MNVGNAISGGPVNVVPDLAVARINLRVADNASAEWFEHKLKTFVESIRKSDGFRCELHGGLTSPAKLVHDEMRQLMAAIESCANDLGQPVVWKSTGGVCDGKNWLRLDFLTLIPLALWVVPFTVLKSGSS